MNENLTKRPFWDFYIYFSFCISAIQVIAYSIGFINDNITEKFILALSDFCRDTMHNVENANDIIDDIKKLGIKTPGHIALIIK